MSDKKTGIQFGCQTYSWQMSIERYGGQVEHMARTASMAGFTGFEPETVMLNSDWTASSLRLVLEDNGLKLAALCLVGSWRLTAETEEERILSDRVIEAVADFPGSIINLVHYPGPDRRNLRSRQDHALGCMRDIARRALDRGVSTSFHPNSPGGSVFRTDEDYERMMDRLDPRIGYTPDTGHIMAGGMDPVETMKKYRARIRYVHVKDRSRDGLWAPTGQGAIDIPGIVEYLGNSGYQGWITFEDESPLAQSAPDDAVVRTGSFVSDSLREYAAPKGVAT